MSAENSSLVKFMVDRYPATIRQRILLDTDYLAQFDISVESSINFGIDEVSFRNAELREFAKRALRETGHPFEISSTSGDVWTLTYVQEPTRHLMKMSRSERVIFINHLGLLSEDLDTRMAFLVELAQEVNLPSNDAAQWRQRLREGTVSDKALNDFADDLQLTPQFVRANILNHFKNGSFSIGVIVPVSAVYYERLIGTYSPGQTFEEYCNTGAANLIETLFSWQPTEAFQFALLLASQPALSALLAGHLASPEVAVDLANWVIAQGDPMSSAAVAEILVPLTEQYTELMEPVKSIIKMAKMDSPSEHYDQYDLFSALFVLVDGTLAKSRVFSSKPPFYRRMAALAQAAMIQECVRHTNGDSKKLAEWARSIGTHPYYMQTIADLRLEPRWHPDYGFASQFKQEFCGRILAAAYKNKEFLEQSALNDDIFGTEDSLAASVNPLLSTFPGPLEGATNLLIPNPYEDIVLELVNEPGKMAGGLVALINLQGRFTPSEALAEAVTEAIKSKHYLIDDQNYPNQLPEILRDWHSRAY